MYPFVAGILQKIGLAGFVHIIAYIICITAGIIFCAVMRFLIRYPTVKILLKITANKENSWIRILIENKFFRRASNLTIPVVLHLFIFDMADYRIFWDKIIEVLLTVIVMSMIASFIRSIGEIYSLYEVSKTVPIRGFLQVTQITLFIVGGIILIAAVVDKSPAVLLGGIGAMTAITSIVFKDAILGFVAGIQLTANDMIRIGDIIEIPSRSAMGIIIDISLTTVKVEDFDKTIIAIPAYTLVSETFVNRRGMLNAGVRRIKRAFNIDATGVLICDGAMIEKFKKIALIKDYICNKLEDIEQSNSRLECDMSENTNGRRMTNIGVFRAYITAYLKNNRHIRQDLPLFVRQLEPSEKGIPFEIYAFANTTELIEYEGIQSDIFDHLYAVITEFGLKLYQNPSSNDILRIIDKET